MVFISFPSSITSEEETLSKKYEKLARKRKALEDAAKPEPEVVTTTNNKPVEAIDAKKVIEKLKMTGQLPQIINNTGRKTEFKRKLPQNVGVSTTSKQAKVSEAPRNLVSYEDDLFSSDDLV